MQATRGCKSIYHFFQNTNVKSVDKRGDGQESTNGLGKGTYTARIVIHGGQVRGSMGQLFG